jgi:hypothetical protein
LSEVAVARRGREFGLGIEAQAREEETGLKSARGRMRSGNDGVDILGGLVRNGREESIGEELEIGGLIGMEEGQFVFLAGM